MNLTFEAKLRTPADLDRDEHWTFVVLPKAESDKFPRRGRTSARGTIDGHPFTAVLEPDGQKSHWLMVPQTLMQEAGVAAGSTVALELAPCEHEFEPALPPEFRDSLSANATAKTTWDATTTVARIDWVHWMESAKQAQTRVSRMADACDMLASGKKRVCCFDPSGFYSKSLSAPREAE